MDGSDERAVAWLEKFQEKEYAKLRLPLPTVRSVEEVLNSLGANPFGIDREAAAKTLEELLLLGSAAPGSRYDDPLFRGLLHHVGRDLESCVAPSLNFRTPIIGYSPLSRPNAMVAFHKPSGRHVIIFQRGQFLFFNRAIAALVHACPIRPRLADAQLEDLRSSQRWTVDNIDRFYQAVPWLLEALLEAMLREPGQARVITQSVCGSDRLGIEPTTDEYEMAYALHECLTAFVLGHEYAHIVENSRVREGGWFGAVGDLSEDETIEFLRNMMSEMAADDLGVGLSLKRNMGRNFGIENSYLGITLFFDLMRFLDRCIGVLRDGQIPEETGIDSLTHPPLLTRREEAEECIARHRGDGPELERGRAVAASFRELLFGFWLLVKPLFEQWHGRNLGGELAPEHRMQVRPSL
ncbi:hypothetical protein L2449_09415 [Mesorhizobium muleiense]|uniref:hypothetical protein n=1 Tax=Mesorhizobium muleiense TaxID=1004279 RepID=UPI001F1E33DF|nr:hypothetical protein [Mesorhizobium muleiense]MCF6117131.1 hypothetical protein [Mesorhizobium muleiense]